MQPNPRTTRIASIILQLNNAIAVAAVDSAQSLANGLKARYPAMPIGTYKAILDNPSTVDMTNPGLALGQVFRVADDDLIVVGLATPCLARGVIIDKKSGGAMPFDAIANFDAPVAGKGQIAVFDQDSNALDYLGPPLETERLASFTFTLDTALGRDRLVPAPVNAREVLVYARTALAAGGVDPAKDPERVLAMATALANQSNSNSHVMGRYLNEALESVAPDVAHRLRQTEETTALSRLNVDTTAALYNWLNGTFEDVLHRDIEASRVAVSVLARLPALPAILKRGCVTPVPKPHDTRIAATLLGDLQAGDPVPATIGRAMGIPADVAWHLVNGKADALTGLSGIGAMESPDGFGSYTLRELAVAAAEYLGLGRMPSRRDQWAAAESLYAGGPEIMAAAGALPDWREVVPRMGADAISVMGRYLDSRVKAVERDSGTAPQVGSVARAEGGWNSIERKALAWAAASAPSHKLPASVEGMSM